MDFNNLKKHRGFTLVELLVSISILTLVLLIIYSMFGFGNNTFVRASSQYDIQYNIRAAQDYMTKQLRYPTEVKLLDTLTIKDAVGDILTPEAMQNKILPYENYIYLYENNVDNDVELVHVNKYFIKKIPVGDSGELTFDSVSPFEELSFILKSNAIKGKQTYNVGSKVKCLNMDMDYIDPANSKVISVEGDKKVVFFRSPSDFWANQLKPMPSFTNNTNEQFSIEFADASYILETASINSFCQLDNDAADNLSLVTSSTSMQVTNIKISAAAEKPIIIIDSTFKDVSDASYEFSYIFEYNNSTGIWSIK